MSFRTLRLGPAHVREAKTMFAMMALVFDEETSGELDDDYVARLLARPDFWAIGAISGGGPVGGLTAHTLPMTRSPSSEIFIYDIAVREDHQRRGIGRELVTKLRTDGAAIGIRNVFVPADNEDTHALDFYRALGGDAAPVTIFTFE